MTLLAFVPCIAVFLYYVAIFVRGILRGKVAEKVTPRNLYGRCYCITGSSRGIGFEVAKRVVEWGGTVVMAVRNVNEVKKKLKSSKAFTHEQLQRIEVEKLDLSSFSSVRRFADKVFLTPQRPLHCLVNNAHHSGLSSLQCTGDGIEHSYQVNYLSHFLLTLLLLPSLELFSEIETSLPSKVINVGSRMFKYGRLRREAYGLRERNISTYNPHAIYADTKLMQLMFTKSLATKCANRKLNISVYYVHPGGLVKTAEGWMRGREYSLMHRFEPILMWLAGTDVPVAAQSVLKVVVDSPPKGGHADSPLSTQLRFEGGRYFNTTYEEDAVLHGCNCKDADFDWLWDSSCCLTGARY